MIINTFETCESETESNTSLFTESAMGISLNSQNNLDSEYVKNVNEWVISEKWKLDLKFTRTLCRLANIIHRRSYDFILRYNALFKFTPTYRRQKILIKALHEFTDNVIVARREKLLNGNIIAVEVNNDALGGRKKMALLDLLLQSKIDGKLLTNEDIREEIDTFMFEVC